MSVFQRDFLKMFYDRLVNAKSTFRSDPRIESIYVEVNNYVNRANDKNKQREIVHDLHFFDAKQKIDIFTA